MLSKKVKTKIVVVTAFSNKSIIEKCANIGVLEVIHKPLTFNKL